MSKDASDKRDELEQERQELREAMAKLVDTMIAFDHETVAICADHTGQLERLARKHGCAVQPLLAWALCKQMEMVKRELGPGIFAGVMLEMKEEMRRRSFATKVSVGGKIVESGEA